VVLKPMLDSGIPLDVIVKGIRDVFRTHKEPRRIRSFAYVADILKEGYRHMPIKLRMMKSLSLTV
jgi:hypothetical protein